MSISPATEKGISPAKTLRGFHAPLRLVESIQRQEESRKKEIRDRIMVVQKCLVEKPADEKGKAELNAAVKWLGENAVRMDDTQKLGAFFPIARVAEEGCGCVDPLEAGLAMSRIAGKLDILNAVFDIMRENFSWMMGSVMNRDIKRESYAIIYHVMLAAAVGDPRAARMVMFWESAGRFSGVVERIEAVHPEMVAGIRAEQERARAKTPSCEQIIAELEAARAKANRKG